MEFLTFAHVVSGATSLIAFLVALFTEKGSRRHQTIGMLFAVTCGLSSGTVVISSLMHNNIAFVPISLQTLITCITGSLVASGIYQRQLLNTYLIVVILTSGWFALSGFMVIMESDIPANAMAQGIFFAVNIGYAVRIRKSIGQRTHSILLVQAGISALTAFGMSTVAPLLGGGDWYFMVLTAHIALQIWCWYRIHLPIYRSV